MNKKILVGFVFLVMVAIISGLVGYDYYSGKQSEKVDPVIDVIESNSQAILNQTTDKLLSDLTPEEQAEYLKIINGYAQAIYNATQNLTPIYRGGGGGGNSIITPDY